MKIYNELDIVNNIDYSEYEQKFKQFSTSVISDALDMVRKDFLSGTNLNKGKGTFDKTIFERGGVLPNYIQSLNNLAETIVGPVTTVFAPNGTSLPLHLAVLTHARNRVLIVATNSYKDSAYIGDIQALIARKNGCKGIILDGFIRDTQGILETSLPVFCVGHLPKRPNKVDDGSINDRIQIYNTVIAPGDLVVADIEGIVVVPIEIVDLVLQAAYQKEKSDEARRKRVLEFNFDKDNTMEDYSRIVTAEVREYLNRMN